MTSSLTGNLIRHIGVNMLSGPTTLKVTEMVSSAAGWILDYGGALQITVAQRHARVAITLTPIPHKCNPNIKEAARRDLNAALLEATKQVFGITTL